jgi:flavorubredoxin
MCEECSDKDDKIHELEATIIGLNHTLTDCAGQMHNASELIKLQANDISVLQTKVLQYERMVKGMRTINTKIHTLGR